MQCSAAVYSDAVTSNIIKDAPTPNCSSGNDLAFMCVDSVTSG